MMDDNFDSLPIGFGGSRRRKCAWEGRLVSIQPRIRLHRSFDERTHSYLGYAFRLRTAISDGERELSIGIGKAAQAKHGFQVGDLVRGSSAPVLDPRMEPVDYYKTSGLKLLDRPSSTKRKPPPWHGPPPELPVYRERGHRRLASRTYGATCASCIWGCRMPVEMTIDHWKPHIRRYRFETFCYGPKSCPIYRPGPTRKVPGRNGMSYEEEDWVDEQETDHRMPDD